MEKITMKQVQASFIGNTILPHMGYLQSTRGIDPKNKKKIIEEFKKDGMEKYIPYLESLSSGQWGRLVELTLADK